MRNRAIFAAIGMVALFVAAGCSDKTADNADTSGNNVGTAEKAGKAVDQTAKDAKDATKNAANDVKQGAKETGAAVGAAADTAAQGVKNAAKTPVWTAKVKNALLADPKIAGMKLNVDTHASTNTVTIQGQVVSQADKDYITSVAKKALGTEANAKIDNQVIVGK